MCFVYAATGIVKKMRNMKKNEENRDIEGELLPDD